MVVVLAAVLGGLAAGLATGGRWDRLGALRLRSPWLVVSAVLAQAAGVVSGSVSGAGAGYAAGLAASAALAGAFLARNRGVPGLGLVAAGFALNALAVVANRAVMPVSLDALGRARPGQGAALLRDPLHAPAGPGTRLRLLTDVVPVPLPGALGAVLSVGDVLVAAGCGLLVCQAVRGRAR